jgi:transposase-like protein
MAGRSPYPPDLRATAYAAMAANVPVAQIATETGIPVGTLSRWKGEMNQGRDANTPMIGHKKQELSDILERIVRKCMKVLREPGKIEESSGAQLQVMIGIGLDKLMALRSKPLVPVVAQPIDGIRLADLSPAALRAIQEILASEGQHLAKLPEPVEETKCPVSAETSTAPAPE